MTETFNRYSGEVRYRIVTELQKKFSEHPVYGKDERPLYKNIFRAMPLIGHGRRLRFPSEAVVITNSSDSMQRLSPDNFVGNYWTFVTKIDHQGNKPGLFLDWVEEDTKNIVKKEKEDISASQNGAIFQLSKIPVVDYRTSLPTNNPLDVHITINGLRAFAKSIDGRTGELELYEIPPPGQEIKATYNYRNLEPIGLYRIEITEVFSDKDVDEICPEDITSFEFYVDVISKRNELLTSSFNPNITSYTLECPVLEVTYGSGVTGYALQVFADRTFRLIPGVDYLYQPATNMIELQNIGYPWGSGAELYAAYRTQGETRGPFKQKRRFYNNRALRGVILAFGDQIQKGDQAYVEVHDERELSAGVYGSLWEVNLDLTVYAKDPLTSLELAKLTHQYLEMDLRPILSFEGIEITQVSMGGEATETWLDNTQDPFYTASISMTMNSFWERRVPIYGNFEKFFIDLFWMIDGTRTYYYIPRPSGNRLLIPASPGLTYNPPKNYPAMTGSLRPKRYIKKENEPPNPNDLTVGFL